MRITACWLTMCTAAICSTLALAQEQDPDNKKQPRRRKEKKVVGEFPEPLQYATGNLRDLEKTRFLSLVGVEDRALDRLGNRGFVWTIKTTRPMSVRHVRALLDKFRHVRFYVRQKTTVKEVHTGLLYYSERIESGAANRLVFSKGEQIEFRLFLGESVRRRLLNSKVDSVVFGPLKR